MTALLFLDVETIHLDPFPGSIWEIAWQRLDDTEPTCFQIIPAISKADPKALEIGGYHQRATDRPATREHVQAALTDELADRPALAGSAPWFDAAHIAATWPHLAGRWHHHHVDIPTLICGSSDHTDPTPPWRLSSAATWAGFDLDDYDRHTAAEDVRLTRDLYLAWVDDHSIRGVA